MDELKERSQEILLDAKSLGKILSLSKRQIFRLKSFHKLPPCVKIGGSIRWRQSDVDRWLAMGCPDQREFEACLKEKQR